MSKKEKRQEHLNAELGGMGLYGTTSNIPVAGYEATGDIENAGDVSKLKKEEGHMGATSSLSGHHQQD
ncbi:hypothetical protein A8F94_22275 [Bacillus sp. FJAT-27225]|uniref:hypothetical protein n=1 Tax=Bacillus sp. FJAT-27225 TaxID=1743144 RepID=UPI00080C2C51|nr:hypothetical protein [Bacillus sp. FJAT-27225]OCA81598.1 hypothetical protein A8F94_22275 [Bacillus sp. FJAT-27225]